MTPDQTTSQETPHQRVECLAVPDLRSAMADVVASILGRGDTRDVPDVLNRWGLLAQFEVYDCDQKWTDLEDAVKELARCA